MIEKPKKERRFLKTLGKIGEILIQEVLLKVGSNLIKRIGGKKTLPSILFLFLSISLFAQFPNTGNKQRLGFQTTADGLVWRGSISDTAAIQPTTNQNAWLIIDTVNLKIYSFDFTSNVWGLVGGGTSSLTMPFDSITFNTAKDGTVGVGEVEYNDTQGSLIQGLKGGLVTNVIGQQLHQRVNNRTGATLAKGTAVYLSGSQGNRITVAKALGVTDAFSANTFGIVAESIANNQSGYVITEGLIKNINTSALVEDSAVYLSPTVAGGLTSTKPQAPQHTVYIGVCVKSNAGSGELFVKIRNGQELDELHDVRISNPSNNASLYYKSSEGIWRDTTAALLVSDTATMLTNYLRSGVASNTYLPLTGGTLSKLSNLNNFTDSILKILYTPPLFANDQNITGLAININNRGYTTTGIISEASTVLNNAIGVKGKANQSDVNGTGIAYGIIGEAAASGSGTNGSTYAGYFNNTSTVGGNHYGLFVNTASGGDYGIYQTGTGINYFGSNSTFAGTLGVTGQSTFSNKVFIGDFTNNAPSSGTNYNIRLDSDGFSSIGFHDYNNTIANIKFSDATGFVIGASDGLYGPHSTTIAGATTLSGALTVNNSTVLNEGSGDFDTRIESDGNANMVFVDASTDRVGIGTNTPSKTLDVNGEVKIATVTATPTALLGKDASNVVGEVTTVAQTGLMTRGSTTATTGTPSAVFNVTHGLGANPTSVIVTGTGGSGAEKLIYEVYAKNSSTFSVQVWKYDGTEAAGISVTIYWLALK